jgi:hypothetical protein
MLTLTAKDNDLLGKLRFLRGAAPTTEGFASVPNSQAAP